jgi:hypothetical protein
MICRLHLVDGEGRARPALEEVQDVAFDYPRRATGTGVDAGRQQVSQGHACREGRDGPDR